MKTLGQTINGTVNVFPSHMDGERVAVRWDARCVESLKGATGEVYGQRFSVVDQRWRILVEFDFPVDVGGSIKMKTCGFREEDLRLLSA